MKYSAILLLALIAFSAEVSAEIKCIIVSGKNVCVDIGSGQPREGPVVIGGNGGCGVNSSCGNNNMGTQEKDGSLKLPANIAPPQKSLSFPPSQPAAPIR